MMVCSLVLHRAHLHPARFYLASTQLTEEWEHRFDQLIDWLLWHNENRQRFSWVSRVQVQGERMAQVWLGRRGSCMSRAGCMPSA